MADVPTPLTPMQLIGQAGQSIPQFQDPSMGVQNEHLAKYIDMIRQGATAEDAAHAALNDTHGPGHAFAAAPAPQAPAPQAAPVPQAAPQTPLAPPSSGPVPQQGTPSARDIPAVAQSAIDPPYVPQAQAPQGQGGVAPQAQAAPQVRRGIGPDMGDTSWMRNPFMLASTAQTLHGSLNNMYNQTFAANNRADIENARLQGKTAAAQEHALEKQALLDQRKAEMEQKGVLQQKALQMKWALAQSKARERQGELAAKYGSKEAELIVKMWQIQVSQGISAERAAAIAAGPYLTTERDQKKRDAIMNRFVDGIKTMDSTLRAQEPDVWKVLHMGFMPVREPDSGLGYDTAEKQAADLDKALNRVSIRPDEPETTEEPAEPTVFNRTTYDKLETGPVRPPAAAPAAPVAPPAPAPEPQSEQAKALSGAATGPAPKPGGDVNDRKGDKTGKTVKLTPEQIKAQLKAKVEAARAAKAKGGE